MATAAVLSLTGPANAKRKSYAREFQLSIVNHYTMIICTRCPNILVKHEGMDSQ